jgi:hypothetical protein
VTTINFFYYYAGTYTTVSATPTYTCSMGTLYAGNECQVFNSQNPFVSYVCPSGWSGPYSGTSECYRTITTTAATCSADGGSYSGTTCTLYDYVPPTYSCSGLSPSGETLSGSTCWWYTYPPATISGYTYTWGYACPGGGSTSSTPPTLCFLVGGSGSIGNPNLKSRAAS